MITVGEVAKMVGKSRTHIHNMAAKGKLSVAKRDKRGVRYFDTAEVVRVFGERSNLTQFEQELASQSEQVITTLKEQIESQRREILRMETILNDEREKNCKLTDELVNINQRLLISATPRKKFLGIF